MNMAEAIRREFRRKGALIGGGQTRFERTSWAPREKRRFHERSRFNVGRKPGITMVREKAVRYQTECAWYRAKGRLSDDGIRSPNCGE